MSATVSEINRGNQHSNKEKYPYFEDVSMHKHPRDYRLIDGCLYKNFEIHVSSSLQNKQEALSIQTNKNFLILMGAKGINMIKTHRWLLPQKF